MIARKSQSFEATPPRPAEGTKIRILAETRPNGDTFHVKVTIAPPLGWWRKWVVVKLLGWEVL